MDRTIGTHTWVTGFDWQQAPADARDDEALSRRLVGALRDREVQGMRVIPSTMALQFGRYILALRLARHWTRPQLAERADIDPLAVALLEEAALTEDELDRTLVQRLAQAFDILERDLVITPFPQETPTPEENVGAWLAGALHDLPASPTPTPTPAARGGGGGLATTTRSTLARPVALPDQTIQLPNGRAGQALLVVEPGDPPEDGAADLHIRLLDEEDRPIVGVTVEVDLESLAFRSGPTNVRGITRITGLPLDALLRQERLVLCLKTTNGEESGGAAEEAERLLAPVWQALDAGGIDPHDERALMRAVRTLADVPSSAARQQAVLPTIPDSAVHDGHRDAKSGASVRCAWRGG
jgi:transcriptional regulator with XRE-family HTH domain